MDMVPLRGSRDGTQRKDRANLIAEVTLNGTYTFDATLRDDWTPQIVVPPYYRQPVHTIKIRINSIYRGTGTSDTYIGILKPIIQ